jgi:hypothetical protein
LVEEIRFAGKEQERSSAPLVARGGIFFVALFTHYYAAEGADDADEGSAIGAGVSFGRALLVVAGPANHRITFAEILAHYSHSYRQQLK